MPAAWSSPLNYLALVADPSRDARTNIIVVESINARGERSRFSNGYGNISAGGELILGLSVASDAYPRNYTVLSGTALAAAQVSGLIAHMYAYAPELTPDRVLDILDVRTANRPARRAPAPPIDAFDAMLRCRERAYKDLADLNADEKVDRRDFELFRDALQRRRGRHDPGVQRRHSEASGPRSSEPVEPLAARGLERRRDRLAGGQGADLAPGREGIRQPHGPPGDDGGMGRRCRPAPF